jgi:hypothetical protein
MGAFVSNKRARGANFVHNPKFGASIEARVFDQGGQIDEEGNLAADRNKFTTEIENSIDAIAIYLRTKLPSHPQYHGKNMGSHQIKKK